MSLNENERNENDYQWADDDHGGCWPPFLVEMSSEEVQRNVEKRMNGDFVLSIVQYRHVPNGGTDVVAGYEIGYVKCDDLYHACRDLSGVT